MKNPVKIIGPGTTVANTSASLRGGWREIVIQIGRLSSIEKFVGNNIQCVCISSVAVRV